MENKVYQYGNTVRLECSFFDFEEQPTDPQIIKVIIYNTKYEIIKEEIIGENNKKETGKYFYDYVTDPVAQRLFYEWYGEIDGTPSLKRGEFRTKFI